MIVNIQKKKNLFVVCTSKKGACLSDVIRIVLIQAFVSFVLFIYIYLYIYIIIILRIRTNTSIYIYLFRRNDTPVIITTIIIKQKNMSFLLSVDFYWNWCCCNINIKDIKYMKKSNLYLIIMVRKIPEKLLVFFLFWKVIVMKGWYQYLSETFQLINFLTSIIL